MFKEHGWTKASQASPGKSETHRWAKKTKTTGEYIMDPQILAAAEAGHHHVVKGGQRPPIIMRPPVVFVAFLLGDIFGFSPGNLFGALARPCFLRFRPPLYSRPAKAKLLLFSSFPLLPFYECIPYPHPCLD